MQRHRKAIITLSAVLGSIACFGQIMPARAGAPCPANIVNSGQSANRVDVDDLLAVIASWGNCPAPPAGCPANIMHEGASANRVEVDDLLMIIASWGPCP